MSRSWTNGLSADEVFTVRQIARLSGRPADQIVRMANHSDLAQAQFQMAVSLATGVWDYLDQAGQ